MAAPRGNQFWKLRSKHGRDKIFASPDTMWEAAVEYFKWCDSHPFYKIEQKRGNTIIPAAAAKKMDEKSLKAALSPIVPIPTMRPYSIHGLTRFMHVNTVYFNHFKTGLQDLKEKQPELAEDFSKVIILIEEIIYEQKFSGAAAGFFNHNIIARDLGLKENSNVGLSDPDGKPLEWKISMEISK